ncbi:S8 family peptidase [Chloroflexota bacterium]
MKNLKLVVPMLITISLLGICRGVTGDSLAVGSENVRYPSPASPVAVSAYISSPLESAESKSDLVENPGPLQSSPPPVWYEQPLPNDPFLKEQWALHLIQAPMLWQPAAEEREIMIAVLDTGIDRNHEDLRGKVAAEVNFTDSPTCHDIHGHGTHVAGIVAASSNNEIGVAGMAPASHLMNIKVADDKGQCQARAVARGIVWAVDNGASVINISLELKEPSSELENAIDYAWSRGAVITAAAGNDGGELPVYPAYYQNCIAVAATTQDDALAPLSNHGDWVDLAAPGFRIYSTLPDDSYGYKSGTSFAAGYVSGMAAMLFVMLSDSNGNGRLNDEVREAIEAGCQEIGPIGVSHGRIDARELS